GAGAIAASWGLMEVLLVTNPFVATWFKHAWVVGLGALTLSLSLLLTRINAPWRTMAVFAGITGLGALFAVWASVEQPTAFLTVLGPLADRLPMALVQKALTYYGLFALAFTTSEILAHWGRGWLIQHVTLPMIIGAVIMGAFAIAISFGRAQEIERRDIAMEELRQAGLNFDLRSLQNVLFFLNDRGVRLYRDAGFEHDDILLALGQTSDFSRNDPLLFAIIDRAEEEADLRGASGRYDPDGRAERFAQMMREAHDDARDPFGGVFYTYENDDQRRAGGRRALLSYALELGADDLVAELFRAGARPLYGADIEATPGDVPAGGGTDDARPGLEPGQAHLHAVLDPVFALHTAHAAAGDRAPAGAACAIAAAVA
ncbi:MAG: hypothetical protein MI723_08160, partial [Caulobacterales bacterium]|nr:hypothetical protein [Caulobacterales bacterium]